jgi:hypothetical protein
MGVDGEGIGKGLGSFIPDMTSGQDKSSQGMTNTGILVCDEAGNSLGSSILYVIIREVQGL